MELLLHWMRGWDIDNKMIWKESAIEQAIFLRDKICTNLLRTLAFVVSTHTSKSITLPVYAFTMRNGIKVICRDNFYGWKLSIELPQDKPNENIIPKDLFECGYMNDIHSCYFEGFEDKWVYGGYNPDDLSQRRFSFGVSNKYDFYVVMYLLKNLYPEIDHTNEANELTKEMVAEEITNIYDKFGYIDFDADNERVMRGWEILWKTCHTLTSHEFLEKNGLDYIPMSIVDDIDEFAEYIVSYPETRKAFIEELKMYTAKF